MTNSKWDAIVPGLTGVIGHQVSVIGVQNALSALGLHIIDAKDKAVLDACSDAQITCPPDCYPDFVNPHPVAMAECARRRDSK
jgi:hypothetical protein